MSFAGKPMEDPAEEVYVMLEMMGTTNHQLENKIAELESRIEELEEENSELKGEVESLEEEIEELNSEIHDSDRTSNEYERKYERLIESIETFVRELKYMKVIYELTE